MNHKYTNALIDESSPYLLQHAHNPVDWVAWGSEAQAKAEKENKLLLVSIGYAASHWCHVMEHECFEDEEVEMHSKRRGLRGLEIEMLWLRLNFQVPSGIKE